MKAKNIVSALAKRHGATDVNTAGKEWAFFEELRAGTGYRTFDYKKGKVKPFNPEQRFDAWAINLYPSKQHERIVYEIKVSRSDFLSEISNPDKRQQALALSNYFYFATPKGLISVDEIPGECGLIEVNDDLSSRIKKKAPYRDTDVLTWQFLCSIARRACVAEKQVNDLQKQIREDYLKRNTKADKAFVGN
ncbi:hypothetical protein [Bacillus niameyensis]|uniref:hypothetical protein n=1 Tax=Bacillus niameyensis TaxID=1522308 RepID=UPI0007865165|nr:hypothetical protein [Bacillus niameyensis]